MPDGGGVVFSSQQQHDQQYIAQHPGEVQQQQQNYMLNSSTNNLMSQSIGNNNSIIGNENSLNIDGNLSMLNDVQNQNQGPGPGVSSGTADLRRDFFEDLRNGGGHWSQLLRQVIFSPPHLNLNRDRGQQQQQQQQQQQDNQNLQSPPPPPATGPPDEDSEENVDGHQQQEPSEQGSTSITIPVQFFGGSENGQFAYIGHLNSDISQWIAVGYLQVGDIILDVHGQQVAGYTQADILSLLHHCLQSSITLTVAPRGSLGPDLRSYLNTRFQKGSVDHALQGVVRDNLYLRTVPVTTRPARPGEIHGIDYTFLSPEEFMELERNGSLLESGVYSGNHYGTPKPWASGLRDVNLQQGNANESGNSAEEGGGNKIPGMHPSSEGKRRRNRSNVEALGQACDDEPSTSNVNNSINQPVTYTSRVHQSDELGPLPENWEMAYTEKGEVYFIDHNTGTSHWLDPRLSRVQKNSLEDCTENELPFGWEKIEDPHYGTYYIDHVNRRTQFENPVIQAKQSTPNKSYNSDDKDFVNKKNPPNPNPKPNSSPNRSISRAKNSMNLFNEQQQQNDNIIMSSLNNSMLQQQDMSRKSNRFFTRDPTQLIGERIVTTLIKSSKGLGFTIVGGDDDDGLDEFLQIKSVVTDGPAWRDSKLRTGDVLVRVSGRCVLGYTHQEMVSIFQSISPGEEVHLEVCRGYPLPFDPADPNTEIVTTVAVAPLPQTDNSNNNDKRPMDWGRSTTPDSLANSAHSLPELSNDRGGSYGKSTGRPASVDLLLDSPSSSHIRQQDKGMQKPNMDNNGVFLSVGILKKDLVSGYGFTIADSVAGQKVKKILDSTHCGGLQEGDRLIAIDGIDLRGLSHTQVVQILKDFPLGKEATLTIQRLHAQPAFSIKFNTASSHYSDSRLLNLRPGISPGRSKTPTADMSQGGRTILPERSKTPLIESTGMNGNQNEQHHIMNMNGGQMFDHFHNSNNEVDQSQIPIIRDWVEMTIELQRKEGFGFRIVGGTEEGSQVSVGHIVPRGAAALDGRLKTNDQIIAVDNISVVGASHHSVVQLMARSASIGRVSLTIRRPVYGISKQQGEYLVSSPTHSPSEIQPIHVMLRRQTTEGFGFVIISSASKAGATIGRIVEESPADRCQQLNVGDRILAVNQIDISQLHHSQVVQLIKESGLALTLSVFPSIEINGGNNSLSRSQQYSISGQPSNMIANDLDDMSLKDSGYDIGTAFISPESYPVHFNSNGQNYTETLEQVFSVHLTRGVAGFGFSIRGGKEFQNMPLFVLRLAGDGPAAMDGRMEVGDQILQINSINTLGMTHSQAIHLIKTGGNNVHLLLRRGAVPFPFLNQMPNFSSEGLGNSNGQEVESLSSNNDLQSPTYIGLSPMYRTPGFPNPQL